MAQTTDSAIKLLNSADALRRNENMAMDNVREAIHQVTAREQAVSHLEASRGQVEANIEERRLVLRKQAQEIVEQGTLLEGKQHQNDDLRASNDLAHLRLQDIEQSIQQRQVDFEIQMTHERTSMAEALTAHRQTLESERENSAQQLKQLLATHEQSVDALEKRAQQAEALFLEYSEKFDQLERV